MPAIEVKPGVYWIGVNDRLTDLFEGLWPITQEGVSYNSYLVLGEKTVLVDLAKGAHADTLLDQITDVVDPAELDYVVVNHMEPDHTGAIRLLTKVAPNITFLCSQKAQPMLEAFFGVDGGQGHVHVVQEGEELALGGKTLRFLMTPFVHWPETMTTYVVEDRIAFTCDAFGGYGALRGAIFDDQCTDMSFYRQEALRYFSNIVAKFSRPTLNAIEKLSKLEVDVVAPSHGLVWRKDPSVIVGLYKHWSEYAGKPGDPGITLIYGSMYGNTEAMMNAVAEGISRVDIPLQIFDGGRQHVSYMLPSLWLHSGVMIGAPTYESSLFPPVANTLHIVAEKRVMNKKVARFGSFGWSGGAQRALEAIIEPLKWDWFDTFEFQGAPTKEDLHKGEDLGERFARSLLES